MVGDNVANELFDLTPQGKDVLRTITEHYGLPLGAIGQFAQTIRSSKAWTQQPVQPVRRTTRSYSSARWPLPRR